MTLRRTTFFPLLLTVAMLTVMSAAPVMAADEVVVAARTKLPTEAEVAKAKADADARAALSAKPATTPEQNVAWLANAQQGQRIDRTAQQPASTGDLTGLKQIHGTAGVSIGTGGYRSAYVTSVIPVGETGLLGIAVSQTDYGKNNRYYGYDDYGYDGLGYGRHGFGYGQAGGQYGGRSQSVGLSLDLNARNRADDTPEGCAPGFRDGDRYVEPLWVIRMNGGRDCGVAEKP